MKEKQEKKMSAWDYLGLALYAFLGLGLEMVLIGVEQAIYNSSLSEYTEWQNNLHWIATCMVWGIFAYVLYRVSKQKYGFDYMKKVTMPSKKSIILAVILTIAGIIEMTISWGGFKPYIEFAGKTPSMFLFQYLYYIFETSLFVLIVIFGQKFGEEKFKNKWIPYGGIVLSLTWGLVHIWTQGIATGIETVVFSIVFGIIYLCVKKSAKLTYFFCACIFLL